MRNWVTLVVFMTLTLAATTLPATSCPLPTADGNPSGQRPEQHSETPAIQAAPQLDVWNGPATVSAACSLGLLATNLALGPTCDLEFPDQAEPLDTGNEYVSTLIGWQVVCRSHAPPA